MLFVSYAFCGLCCLPHGFFLRVVSYAQPRKKPVREAYFSRSLKKPVSFFYGQQEDFNKQGLLAEHTSLFPSKPQKKT